MYDILAIYVSMWVEYGTRTSNTLPNDPIVILCQTCISLMYTIMIAIGSK